MRRSSDLSIHGDRSSNNLPDASAATAEGEWSSDVSESRLERRSPTIVMPFSTQFRDITKEDDVDGVSEKEFPWLSDDLNSGLGDGPMRFSPNPQLKNQKQRNSNDYSSSSCSERSHISSGEKKCCEHLKKRWELANPEVPFSYEMYLRLQNEKRCIAATRGHEEPEYVPFGLSIEELEPQLLTGVRSNMHGRFWGASIGNKFSQLHVHYSSP
jgi:hypothetical protein